MPRRTSTTARRPRKTPAQRPPLSTQPAENLALLRVIHPADYRNLCGLMTFAIERQWHQMTAREQRAAVDTMDRRRKPAR